MAHTAEKLAEIPLIDLGAGGPLALLDRERARAQALLAAGRRRHGRIVLRLGDRLSRTWLERAANPFRAEILDVARAIGHPGAVLLNLSYEWGCTTGAAPDPSGQGSRMLRVLDWPLDGLGRHVVVARQAGAHGPYYNVTWPGSVGVLTAMAPGRFSAAINQAPMARHGLTLVGDWTKNRIAVWHSRELPPAHLMRRVFETARDYAEAKAMLAQTPLAMPVLFTLSGVEPAEGCIIERFADRTRITEGAAADGRVVCANQWLSARFGRPRGQDNAERMATMAAIRDAPLADFAWLAPPLLNPKTRLAVEANARTGRLAVLGIERERPATQEFRFLH